MKLLDRVPNTEQALDNIVKAIQAIVRVVGVSEVQAELAAATQANLKAQVEAGLKEGKILPAEVVTEKSFIVGHELDKDGKLANPRFQLGFMALSEDSRKLFLGKKPGEVIETPNGTIAIDETYDVVEAQGNA